MTRYLNVLETDRLGSMGFFEDTSFALPEFVDVTVTYILCTIKTLTKEKRLQFLQSPENTQYFRYFKDIKRKKN